MIMSGAVVTLATAACAATVDLRGGGIAQLTWRGRDLLESYPHPGGPDPAPLHANTVLAPWPNRTRDARFSFDGHSHRLTVTEPARNTALHGFVAGRRWTVSSARADAATLTLAPGPQPGWPWDLRFTVTYRLTDDGLAAGLTVYNAAGQTAPAACGVHLYPSALGAATDDCTLVVPDHRLVPLDDRGLPAGPESADRGVLPARANPLRGRLLDHCLHVPGQGGADIRLTGPDGGGVALRTSTGLRWLQVFTADRRCGMPFPGRPDGRAVAVEPMTAPPDALNSGTGLARLPPGGELHCSWTVTAIPPVP